MRYDEGYKLHVGALSSEYVLETGMSDTTFNSIMSDVYTEVCDAVKENLKQHRQSFGYHGLFLGAQLDLTTVANEEYITFSVCYIAEGDATITRVGLATRAFPGTHTASDIEPWIEKASCASCFECAGFGSVGWYSPCASKLKSLLFYFLFFSTSFIERRSMLSCLLYSVFILFFPSCALYTQLTTEFFADMMGPDVKPKDGFLAFTVDQGGNVVNACILLEVEVIKCPPPQLRQYVGAGDMQFRQEVRKPGDGKADKETGGACRGI